MKKKFLDYAISLIHKNHPDYDDIKLAELRYGLEGFYLSVTKMVVIITLAIILGIFKEMFFMLVIFNVLRTTGFGLHATKSWICLLSSSTIFLLFPMLAKIVEIPSIIKFLLAILSIICVILYAPADTKKRPLINKKKRTIYKIITSISCIILNLLALLIKNPTISNLIIFGIWTEIVLILPISYRLFHLSYNNYKNYKPIHG